MPADGQIIEPKRFTSIGWWFFAAVQIFGATVYAFVISGRVAVFRQIWVGSPMLSLAYWTAPLFALYLLQPMFGLNRFGRRMLILNALACVPLAALAQWNSKLSDTRLGIAMLGLAGIFEALAVAILVAEIKQRRRESQGK